MINPLHQTPEEKLAVSSRESVRQLQTNGEKVDGVREAVEALHTTTADKSVEAEGHAGTQRKLDEVKSAALMTNKHLKDANSHLKDIAPALAKSTNAGEFIDGFLKAIHGDKGEKGDKGEMGSTGPTGSKGERGLQGIPGQNGEQGPMGYTGATGPKGETGPIGIQGIPGPQGSPDEPNDVVKKVNLATVKIDPKQVKGLARALKEIEGFGTNQNPQGQNVGGNNPLKMQSAGTDLGAFISTINFSTNLTAVYSGNGVVTVTATGGAGGSGYQAPLTGALTGTNTWTTAPNVIVVDGVPRQKTATDGTINWTGTTTTILTIAPTFDVFSSA